MRHYCVGFGSFPVFNYRRWRRITFRIDISGTMGGFYLQMESIIGMIAILIFNYHRQTL